MRILRGIAVLLFHDMLTGIVRTFITIFITIVYPLPAKNDLAVLSTKVGFMIVWTIAALTRIILNQGLRTDITVQTARGHHIRLNILLSFIKSSLIEIKSLLLDKI